LVNDFADNMPESTLPDAAGRAKSWPWWAGQEKRL
jgi:hypothetical protein